MTDKEVKLHGDVTVPSLWLQLHVLCRYVTFQVCGDSRVVVSVAGKDLHNAMHPKCTKQTIRGACIFLRGSFYAH